MPFTASVALIFLLKKIARTRSQTKFEVNWRVRTAIAQNTCTFKEKTNALRMRVQIIQGEKDFDSYTVPLIGKNKKSKNEKNKNLRCHTRKKKHEVSPFVLIGSWNRTTTIMRSPDSENKKKFQTKKRRSIAMDRGSIGVQLCNGTTIHCNGQTAIE